MSATVDGPCELCFEVMERLAEHAHFRDPEAEDRDLAAPLKAALQACDCSGQARVPRSLRLLPLCRLHEALAD
jgi:hypothetical protein